MNTRRLTLTAVAATAAALSTGAALAHDQAAVVSAQHDFTGHRAPVTVPGTGVKQGKKLAAGDRLISRTMTLEEGQHPHFTLTAAHGRTIRGLAEAGKKMGFAVVGSSDYVGKRTVHVRVFTAPNTKGMIAGRVYALTQ